MILGFLPQRVVADRVCELMPCPGQPEDDGVSCWPFFAALHCSHHEPRFLQQLHMRPEFERINPLEAVQDACFPPLPEGQVLHGQDDAPDQVHISFQWWLLWFDVNRMVMDNQSDITKEPPPHTHMRAKDSSMQTSAPPTPAAPPAFTPGPWAWSETGYSLRPAEPNPDVHHVHTILDAEDIGRGFRAAEFKDSLAEGDANLALIAAAPDLYDAAEAAAAVLLHRKWKGGATNPQAIALAALDKARTVVPTYVIS